MALEEKYILSEISLSDQSQTDIDYFRIKPSYFPKGTRVEKINIQSDKEGYVTSNLLDTVDIEKGDTTIFNIGVGQGKSTAIYQLAKEYTVVIIASPYRTLVKKDYEYLVGHTTEEEVLHYDEIGELSESHHFEKVKAHIITVNSLMGNPGNETIDQASEKKEYLKKFRTYLKVSGKRAVIFFDEIHASIQSFDPLYILNIRLWKEVTHKVFISSATFSPTSVVASIHLTYLTSTGINNASQVTIFESERKPRKRPGELYLHVVEPQSKTSQTYYEEILYHLVKSIADEYDGTHIDILSNHKAIAQSLEAQGEGELQKLVNTFDPNYVTGSTKLPYQKDRCNIGTSFYTGINIDSADDVLIFVVGNAVDNRTGDLRPYGIFAGGDLAIVQAFARVRKGGTAHVILPLDDHLRENEEVTASKLAKLRALKQLNEKWRILKREYELRTSHLKNEIQKVRTESVKIIKGDREGPLVFFPDFYSFALNSGDDYLTSHYPSYGKGVTQFILRASFDGHFTNLRLNGAKVYQIPKKEVNITNKIPENVEALIEVLPEKEIKSITNKLESKECSDSDAFKTLFTLVKDLVEGVDGTSRLVLKKGKRKLYKSDLRRDRKFLRSLISLLYKLKFKEKKTFDKVEDYILNNIAAANTYSLTNRKAWAYKRLAILLKGFSIAKKLGIVEYIERIGFEKHEQEELENIATVLNERDFFISSAYSFLNKAATIFELKNNAFF